jgi:hypothetical protein
MLRRLSAARATQKRSRACALCAFLFRHIFAVAGTLRVPLSQPQKRHIPPERYAKLRFAKCIKNHTKYDIVIFLKILYNKF